MRAMSIIVYVNLVLIIDIEIIVAKASSIDNFPCVRQALVFLQNVVHFAPVNVFDITATREVITNSRLCFSLERQVV